MAASKINSSLSSAPALIKGELGILPSIDDFVSNFVGELESVLETFEELAEEDLRESMAADSAWEPVSKYASVVVDSGVITYSHTGDDSVDSYAFNLEFGVRPNPVIRKTVKRQEEQLSPQLSKMLSGAVPSA
jgi:hypothetical protein